MVFRKEYEEVISERAGKDLLRLRELQQDFRSKLESLYVKPLREVIKERIKPLLSSELWEDIKKVESVWLVDPYLFDVDREGYEDSIKGDAILVEAQVAEEEMGWYLISSKLPEGSVYKLQKLELDDSGGGEAVFPYISAAGSVCGVKLEQDKEPFSTAMGGNLFDFPVVIFSSGHAEKVGATLVKRGLQLTRLWPVGIKEDVGSALNADTMPFQNINTLKEWREYFDKENTDERTSWKSWFGKLDGVLNEVGV